MNVMQNLTVRHADSQQQFAPKISDALRTARAVHFRLEDEYHPFGWEERLENAALLREMIDEVPEELRDLVRGAEVRLESEAFDFSDWQDRSETAGIIRDVITGLQKGHALSA
jgi:hypothetical protein